MGWESSSNSPARIAVHRVRVSLSPKNCAPCQAALLHFVVLVCPAQPEKPNTGHPLEGFVKWAHDSSLSRSTFFSSSFIAFHNENPDSHLGLLWNRCRLPQSETHQSPIRIKAEQIGAVLRSDAPGTCVPQKHLSARRLSMPKTHKSCGSHRARNRLPS